MNLQWTDKECHDYLLVPDTGTSKSMLFHLECASDQMVSLLSNNLLVKERK